MLLGTQEALRGEACGGGNGVELVAAVAATVVAWRAAIMAASVLRWEKHSHLGRLAKRGKRHIGDTAAMEEVKKRNDGGEARQLSVRRR